MKKPVFAGFWGPFGARNPLFLPEMACGDLTFS
jgi:hypothetical protein